MTHLGSCTNSSNLAKDSNVFKARQEPHHPSVRLLTVAPFFSFQHYKRCEKFLPTSFLLSLISSKSSLTMLISLAINGWLKWKRRIVSWVLATLASLVIPKDTLRESQLIRFIREWNHFCYQNTLHTSVLLLHCKLSKLFSILKLLSPISQFRPF